MGLTWVDPALSSVPVSRDVVREGPASCPALHLALLAMHRSVLSAAVRPPALLADPTCMCSLVQPDAFLMAVDLGRQRVFHRSSCSYKPCARGRRTATTSVPRTLPYSNLAQVRSIPCAPGCRGPWVCDLCLGMRLRGLGCITRIQTRSIARPVRVAGTQLLPGKPLTRPSLCPPPCL